MQWSETKLYCNCTMEEANFNVVHGTLAPKPAMAACYMIHDRGSNAFRVREVTRMMNWLER